MILPEGFEILPGFQVSKTDVVLGKISGPEATLLLYGNESVFQSYGIMHQTILPAETDDESNVLSSQLGVDESIRKMLVERSPAGIYGVVVINEHRGIMAVIRKVMGGVSGAPGIIRSVEYMYKFPAENIKDEKQFRVIPLFPYDMYEQYPREVVNTARTYNASILREISLINDERFKNLFSSYERLKEKLETIGSYLERVNKEVYDQLMQSSPEGVLFSEYPLIKLQNLIDGADRVLSNTNVIKTQLM